MTYGRETSNVKRISLFLRENRDGSDVSSSRVAPVALTIHEQRGDSQAGY